MKTNYSLLLRIEHKIIQCWLSGIKQLNQPKWKP